MTILLADSLETAHAYNARAIAQLRTDDGARGNRWSDIFVDYGAPTRYGILFAPEIAGAFTEAELAAIEENAQPLVRNEQGQFVSGNWDVWTPPANEEGEL